VHRFRRIALIYDLGLFVGALIFSHFCTLQVGYSLDKTKTKNKKKKESQKSKKLKEKD